jgi:mRNA interferase MazF
MTYGDVCLINFPFTDGSSAKVRPVLIVSVDKYSAMDVVVVPITSSLPSGDDCIRLDSTSPHFASSGLAHSSTIKCGKPFTLDRAKFKRRLGALDESLLKQVRSNLARVLSIS